VIRADEGNRSVPGTRPTRGWKPRHRAGPLPGFLVIGAMKSGTTSLFHYLADHPQIHMSPLKEVDFFIREGNWGRGVDWYRRQFSGASRETMAIGEASTSYTKFPEFSGVPERIASTLPDVRLIYVVRDPIERIRSHYQHRVLIGAERAPLDVAVVEDSRYVDCSRYAFQLEQYRDFVDPRRMLVVTSDSLRSERESTMRGIYGFLGVDPNVRPGTLDREFYRTEERAAYPPLVWWIRRTVKRYVPSGKRAKELIDLIAPTSLRRLPRRSAAAATAPPPTLSEDVRRRLAGWLQDDVEGLRRYLPESFDGWGIA